MRIEQLRKGAGGAVTAFLTVHLAASVLQNTPESFNQDLRKFIGGWPIPGWRFFAPNPGIQNVHLLVRDRAAGNTPPTTWRDVTPTVQHGVLQVLWNPASRGPKALFDAMQQLSVMSASQAEFTWVTQSLPYRLAATTSAKASSAEAADFQFLLMNAFPSAPEDQRMKPILISEWIPVGPDASSARAAA